jgi:predicted dehydrogenase
MIDLRQAWPRPAAPRPIVFVGAGAIVRTAHLPAYTRLRFPIAGLFDLCRATAERTAQQFGGLRVFSSVAEVAAAAGAIVDVAVPGKEIAGVLAQLPRGAAVLIQKPMGETLAAAREILGVCRERELVAAMNFQLRFSPNVMALTDLVAADRLGDLTDIEVRIVDRQPWEQWSFLKHAPRLEVLYHSIHYLDAIRWIAGEPLGAYCRTVAHPQMPRLRDTRSSIILDYDDRIRCSLVMNHTHRAGPRHRASQLLVEGTRGAARLTWGVNLSYPSGPPDTMEISRNGHWTEVALRGSWFTEAFEGPMSNLQRFAAGEDPVLMGSIDDAIKTMALTEACYQSSDRGGTPIPTWD